MARAQTDKTDMPMQALQNEGVWAFFTQSVQALPFHIYTLAKLPDDPLAGGEPPVGEATGPIETEA